MKYINNEKLDEYLINHSEKEPEILSDLNRETNQKVLQPRMISGAYQGRLLSIISKIINPKKNIRNWNIYKKINLTFRKLSC